MLLYFGLLIPLIGAHVVISEFSLKQTKLADKALDNTIKEELSNIQKLTANQHNDNSKKNAPDNEIKLRVLDNSVMEILSKKQILKGNNQNEKNRETIPDNLLKLTGKAFGNNINEVSSNASDKQKLTSQFQKDSSDSLISKLIKPEFDQLGQKRFRTVKNPILRESLHFIVRKPVKLAIRKRSFDSEPKMELNNLVLNSMAVNLGDTKLETKEAKFSMIEAEPGKEEIENEGDNNKALELDSNSNLLVFLVPH